MGKVLIAGGAGGGVGSDDVTATKADVLAGRTTITRDSNDEVVVGGMQDCNHGGQSYEIGWDNNLLSMWARLPYRNGYYHNSGNDPWLYIHKDKLIAVLGLDPAQWVNTYNIMGLHGQIGRWICGTGDAISALNNEGHIWDDTYAGRGRGIITRVPNNYKIENANWVFLPSPNLFPHNIAKGVNINGLQGTRDVIDLVEPRWMLDGGLDNLQVRTFEQTRDFPDVLSEWNGLFAKVVLFGIEVKGYTTDVKGGKCPMVFAQTKWDNGAHITVVTANGFLYMQVQRYIEGFHGIRVSWYGSSAFTIPHVNFLITQAFTHQWAGNYATP